MLDRGSEGANVGRGRPADGPTVVQGMIDDDVVANPRMNGEGYLVPVGDARTEYSLNRDDLRGHNVRAFAPARSAPKAVRSTEPIFGAIVLKIKNEDDRIVQRVGLGLHVGELNSLPVE